MGGGNLHRTPAAGVSRSVRSYALALCMAFAIAAVPVQAQVKNITLKASNTPVSTVMQQIEEQSGYTFFYNTKDIPLDRNVTLSVANKDIRAALDELFRNTNVSYSIDNKSIILSARGGAQPQQASQITGRIVDKNGVPVIGATIMISGTTQGTTSGVDGTFALQSNVSPAGMVLDVSFIGYKPQRISVNNRTSLSVTLEEDDQQIEAVVVTALGIKRQERAVSYNVQNISDEVFLTRDANMVNSLAGKIAGVTINASAAGVGGETKVVMRGSKSIAGSNNALYVLDGIPLPSLSLTNPGDEFTIMRENNLTGDGISNFNLDDIASMAALTGPSAAALYGSQAANGVLMLTTRSGEEGVSVNYSNNTTFMSPFLTPAFQNTYGAKDGYYASWGSKLVTKQSWTPTDFYQTGYNTSNSVGLSFGGKKSQTYVSAGVVTAEGIIPNNEYNRYNFTANHSSSFLDERMHLSVLGMYMNVNEQNMLSSGQYYNPMIPVYLMSPSDDIRKYAVYERYNASRNFPVQYWPWGSQSLQMQNPYWITNRNMFNTTQNRYIVSGSPKWKITDWINLSGRIRMDHADTDYERKLYASTPGLFCQSKGHYREQKMTNNALYADVLLNIDKQLSDDFRLTANIGASLYDEKYDMMGQSGNLLRLANFFHVSNINMSDPTTEMTREHIRQQTQAVYGSVQVGFRNFVYVDASVRSDWFSTLAGTPSMSSVYPSVGASLILSELIPQNKILNYWKIRGSYAGVGNPPSPYLTYTYIPLEDQNISTDGFAAASHLKPELTKSFEIGTELRMFNNKLSLEFTYYNTNTHNQLFKYEIPSSSGYSYAYANAGKVNNRGIELKAGFNQNIGPVKWETTLTYTRNRNEIKELLDEYVTDPVTGTTVKAPQEFIVSTAESYRMVLTKGGTMGDIYATHLKQDPNGYIYVNPMTNGIEIEPNSYVKVGSIDPKYTLGWHNSFSWKGLNLGFLIDARVGGVVVSGTEAMMDQYGVSKSTARDRDNGGAIVNGGRMDAKTFYSVAASGTTGVLSNYVYSATNVRLRELSLSYTLPALARERLRITLSLIANNVLMLHNEAPFDPELTSNTGTYYQGFDYFMPPSLRSWGFGVKVNF